MLGRALEATRAWSLAGAPAHAQVHKAKLRSFPAPELRRARSQWRAARPAQHVVADGQGVWDICNLYGVSVGELDRLNKGVPVEQTTRVCAPPCACKLAPPALLPAVVSFDLAARVRAQAPTCGSYSRARW